MPRPTLKTLTQEIHNIANEAPSAVQIRLGASNYALTGTYVATLTGERFAALIIGDKTWYLEIDRKGSKRNAKVLQAPDVVALARDLLPEPEPPAEVIAANAALAALPKLPKGYHYAMDGKGNLAVKAEDGRDPLPSAKPPQRAPKGEGKPGNTKPAIVKGMKLTRKKDGHVYTVTGIDAKLKKVYLEPLGEGEKNLAQTYPTLAWWNNWQEGETADVA